ncbi:hypothetical protein DFH08DRAFT_799917 [Mycena albidolilacea]|uniref:Uncharacterized protein n=1 Tax=Mycena albidolilacea TaxID=1033008 RepID=A0AAD7AMR4_9AGAR|nr:hypothetical protein DFH08DRAFT_799917 [Mycena albidolilacea]
MVTLVRSKQLCYGDDAVCVLRHSSAVEGSELFDSVGEYVKTRQCIGSRGTRRGRRVHWLESLKYGLDKDSRGLEGDSTSKEVKLSRWSKGVREQTVDGRRRAWSERRGWRERRKWGKQRGRDENHQPPVKYTAFPMVLVSVSSTDYVVGYAILSIVTVFFMPAPGLIKYYYPDSKLPTFAVACLRAKDITGTLGDGTATPPTSQSGPTSSLACHVSNTAFFTQQMFIEDVVSLKRPLRENIGSALLLRLLIPAGLVFFFVVWRKNRRAAVEDSAAATGTQSGRKEKLELSETQWFCWISTEAFILSTDDSGLTSVRAVKIAIAARAFDYHSQNSFLDRKGWVLEGPNQDNFWRTITKIHVPRLWGSSTDMIGSDFIDVL